MPADDHVHTEWSWDAPEGSMRASCERALRAGLPAVSFTEHADFTAWWFPSEVHPRLPALLRERLRPDGVVEPPDLRVPEYFTALARVRHDFPDLRIRSGVELSEPHWHPERTAALLAAGPFERVLGSVHSRRSPSGMPLLVDGPPEVPADERLLDYLAEVGRLVRSDAPFDTLAHIDYPLRFRPPPDLRPFREEFRAVLEALADSGRALELNTRVPLGQQVLGWWARAGGTELTFGSDAHRPGDVAHGFREAAAMAEAAGFRPCTDDPTGPWSSRSRPL